MKIAVFNAFSGLAMMVAAASLGAQQPAASESVAVEYPPVYRVELIVFSHADGRSDRIRGAGPLDFTDRSDPLLVARANAMAERQLAGLAGFLPVARVPGEIRETTPYLQSQERTLRPIPPVYSALGDLSRPIQRAMDRLLDAPEYDPVTARAWIQLAPRNRPIAAMRIHDQTVVDRVEPEDGQSLVPVPNVLPFGPLTEMPPPALDIYRLDGTLRLRRRQFLHLDLDLAWQARARGLANRMPPTEESAAVTSGTESGQGEWQLHRLQQSRIVEPGRLEYFDSSLFGVLVLIERFEQVVPEIEIPEPQPATPNTPTQQQSADPVTNSGG